MYRCVNRAQKIRMRLGGSANLCEPSPEKPRRMRWRAGISPGPFFRRSVSPAFAHAISGPR